MDFQIKALSIEAFSHLFELSDEELVKRQARRISVEEKPGTPCRVSMRDADVGETVILLNYTHQPADTPYQARHAIFVRQNAEQAELAINEVPDVIRTRLISVRFFDHDHMMIGADVVPGDEVASVLGEAFENSEIAYAHLHNAKPGCFAASAQRVS